MRAVSETRPHILIVDDDREIRDLTARFLRRHGFRATPAADGREMDAHLAEGRFDLVVLDLMMPGEDGLSICRRLRAQGSVPIVMVTALGEETDRIVGLEMGADDYVPKPFNRREFLARIMAVLRRSAADAAEAPARGSLRFAGWTLDRAARELRNPSGEPVMLTAGEFDLLVALAERPQRVLSRDRLLDLTRGREAVPFDRSVDVQLSRLRRKVEADPANPILIKTVRGGGYVFAAEVAAVPS